MDRLNLISKHLTQHPTYWVLKNFDQQPFVKYCSLKNKTILISGASRGIGLAVAKRAAQDGANVAILAKTSDPHPKLEGTIHSAAAEIEKLGGKALAIQCDIRFEDQVKKAVELVVKTFGGIDVLVNNASAISISNTVDTNMKTFDLMHGINTRGSFLLAKTCIPYLLKAENPHILNMSPPLSMNPKWFSNSLAYTMAKYGMSMCVLGMSEEYKGQIAVNALWPRTTIATAAVRYVLGGDEMIKRSRKEEIIADAAYIILTSKKDLTGNFFIDDEVIGPMDLKKYNIDPSLPIEELMPDGFID